MKPTRRKSKFAVQEDSDPLSVVVNLFDVAMVFAVAMMVALVSRYNMTEASASASPTNWKTEKSFMYQNNKQNGK